MAVDLIISAAMLCTREKQGCPLTRDQWHQYINPALWSCENTVLQVLSFSCMHSTDKCLSKNISKIILRLKKTYFSNYHFLYHETKFTVHYSFKAEIWGSDQLFNPNCGFRYFLIFMRNAPGLQLGFEQKNNELRWLWTKFHIILKKVKLWHFLIQC